MDLSSHRRVVQLVMLMVLLLCQISTAFLDDASIWISREGITEEVKDKHNGCRMQTSLRFYRFLYCGDPLI